MANNNEQNGGNNHASYAARHPRRMYSTAFIMGTAIGASLMAARKNRDKNALQKFMDQISH